MNELTDSFGRKHRAMRVSVTDRCNLRCHYCMPEEGMEYLPKSELLSYEELTRIVRVGVEMGIEKVRVTGGEPLLRNDLDEFLGMLGEIEGLKDLSLTTNGLLLEKYAERLAAAGLKRINVSLDSLDAGRFESITRWGVLEKVWAGIEAAEAAGIKPIKINALVLKGFNDDEFDRWVDLVRTRDISVRFMELMPIGENALEEIGEFYDLTELRRRLEDDPGIQPDQAAHRGNGPARYWKAPGWKGSFGFITPMSNSYCATCSRLRLTCQGELRACLAYDEHIKLREAARRGDDSAIRAGYAWAVSQKRSGHPWHDGIRTETGMSAMGG